MSEHNEARWAPRSWQIRHHPDPFDHARGRTLAICGLAVAISGTIVWLLLMWRIFERLW